MTPGDFLKDILAPGLAWFEQNVGFVPPASREARLLLLAIAGQESNWENVAQGGGGPGRGPWQFEPETCREILFNPATEAMATKVCMALNVVPSRSYDALMIYPNLAVAFGRLDLWANPHPLPPYGNENAGYKYYLDTWRPGSPYRPRWAAVYPQALAADRAWAAGAMNQEAKP